MLQVMVEEKCMVLEYPTRNNEKKMCMIGTEEYNNESTRMNADSMICDKEK